MNGKKRLGMIEPRQILETRVKEILHFNRTLSQIDLRQYKDMSILPCSKEFMSSTWT